MKVLSAVPIESFPDAYNFLLENADTTFLKYPTYEEVFSIISQFDGIFPNAKMRIDEKLLKSAENLKVISIPAMGTDNIDLSFCKQKGIKVFSLSDAKELMMGIPSTAEFTIALMLSLLKKLYHSTRSVLVDSKWITSDFRGYDLKGKTVGIIGYGVVGQNVAKLLSSFDVNLLVHDPFIESKIQGTSFTSMEELLKNSDIVTVHVPFSPETKNLIDSDQFGMMQDTIFINASRGEVINENALIEALENKYVRSAGLDVLVNESDLDFSSNALINYARLHDNLIITPHCAGSSNDALKQTFLFSAKRLIHHLQKNES